MMLEVRETAVANLYRLVAVHPLYIRLAGANTNFLMGYAASAGEGFEGLLVLWWDGDEQSKVFTAANHPVDRWNAEVLGE